VTILSIGIGGMGKVWDWYFRYMQPFPMLSDMDGSVFFMFGTYTILLDEGMKIHLSESIYDDDLFRSELSDICNNRILIDHVPLPNTEDNENAYSMDCTIQTTQTLDPDTLIVYWNTDGGSLFQTAPLTPEGGTHYSAAIPAHPTGTTMYYYIHAESVSGSIANDPWVAPDELYTFNILTDTDPPVITHDAIPKWTSEKWPPLIEANVSDALPITVVLDAAVNGGAPWTVPMSESAAGLWTAPCPGSVTPGDTVSYRITAGDTAETQNVAVDPPSGTHDIQIFENLPAAVVDLDPNHSSGPVIRDTLLNLAVDTDYFDAIPQHPGIYDSLFTCAGVAPNHYELTFPDTAVFYFYMQDGGHMYLEGGNVWADCYHGYMHRMFRVISAYTGEDDTEYLNGLEGSPTEHMTFHYTGENESMDRLVPGKGINQSVPLFRNLSPRYFNAFSNSSDKNRTIAVSFEFAGLENDAPPNTRERLMQIYAAHFGLTDPPPTFTPTPSLPSPTPTETPSECDTLGATVSMPAHSFTGGNPCGCTVTLCNPGTLSYSDVPVFVILECAGYFFFWPDFSEFAYDTVDLVPGEMTITVLPAFDWPNGAGSGSAIWYAGMTTWQMRDLFGEMSSWSFNWSQ